MSFAKGLARIISYVWKRKYPVLAGVFGFALGVIVVVWWTGLSADSIPSWGWVAIITTVATLPYGVAIALFAISLVFEPHDVVLVELKPETGDIAVHDIATEKYNDLVVLDANGSEIGKEYLQEVDVKKAGRAFEVTSYNPDRNVAEVSWMGEATNREIRRHQSLVKQIKESLSPLARSYRDMHARMDVVIEDKVSDSMNAVLAMIEDVDLPPGEQLHEQMSAEPGEQSLEQLPDPDEELEDIATPAPEDMDDATDSAPQTGGDAP